MGKAFEKQIKTTEVQGQKQVDVLKDLKLKEQTRRRNFCQIIRRENGWYTKNR